MNDTLVKVIINGLHGENTHLKPQKAMEGLTPASARNKPDKEFHSCWDILHHIVVWQEGILQAIKGEKVDWKDIGRSHNWPTNELLTDDSNFSNLLNKFENGLNKAEELAKTIDLNKPMPAWGGAPVIQAFIVLLQHNSYHLGQIVAVRKMLGNWPS
ncbi:MAG: DinB family protein [Promethearchaeota archaeon]